MAGDAADRRVVGIKRYPRDTRTPCGVEGEGVVSKLRDEVSKTV
jgi:hypothetical protein